VAADLNRKFKCCKTQDPRSIAAHKGFIKKLQAAEKEMIARNQDASSRARNGPSGLPYTLLYPSTDTKAITPENRGMTGRGVP
jgi:hypothetical protein